MSHMGLELDKNKGDCDGNNKDAVKNFEYVNNKNNDKIQVQINNLSDGLHMINGYENVQMPHKAKLNKILIVDD